MSFFRATGIRLWLLVIVFAGTGRSVAAPIPSASALPAATLTRLTRSSAYIFSGTVVAVEHVPSSGNNGLATVRVTFRVDQGMQGVRTGQMLTIREWAGLWQGGERYRRGERMVLFLHRPSRLGLTSPVGGPMGRFTVDRSGSIVLDPGKIGAPWPAPLKTSPITSKARISGGDFARAVLQAGRR